MMNKMKKIGLLIFAVGMMWHTPYAWTQPEAELQSVEKIEAWRLRFKQGVSLLKAGKQQEAFETFQSILEEDPYARGSLFLSGVILNQRFQFKEAGTYFERFLKLEPRHAAGLIGAVKAFQGIGDRDKVTLYLGKLNTLKNGGQDPRLNQMKSFEREIIPLKGGQYVSVQEFFTYKISKMDNIWSYVLMKKDAPVNRKLEFIPAPPEETKRIRLGNPNVKGVFLLSESILDANGSVQDVKIRKMFFHKPKYGEVRDAAVAILSQS